MREKLIAIGINTVVIVVIFLAGYFAGYHRAITLLNDAVQDVNVSTTAAKATADAQKTASEQGFDKGVSDDKAITKNVPTAVERIVYRDRIVRVPDSKTNSTSKTNYTAADFRKIEATNARLRDALSGALVQYGQEAERGNNVQRQLNLCIDQLEQDREQVATAQQLN